MNISYFITTNKISFTSKIFKYIIISIIVCLYNIINMKLNDNRYNDRIILGTL